MPKKGGLRPFADLRGGGGGLARKRGMVFLREGVDTPMYIMIHAVVLQVFAYFTPKNI